MLVYQRVYAETVRSCQNPRGIPWLEKIDPKKWPVFCGSKQVPLFDPQCGCHPNSSRIPSPGVVLVGTSKGRPKVSLTQLWLKLCSLTVWFYGSTWSWPQGPEATASELKTRARRDRWYSLMTSRAETRCACRCLWAFWILLGILKA